MRIVKEIDYFFKVLSEWINHLLAVSLDALKCDVTEMVIERRREIFDAIFNINLHFLKGDFYPYLLLAQKMMELTL